MTTSPTRRRLPVVADYTPKRRHVALRRATQLLTLVAVALAPVLGGWQRLDSNHLSAWDGRGWDLPAALLTRLPAGEAPARAYELNRALGGGVAADYLGVPAVDPVAGAVALSSGQATGWLLLAWALPLALALVAGRAFCGWFCPFGTLARLLEAALARLPWRPPRVAVPRRRPLRWLVLAGAALAGALGLPGLLYLLLPHALLQQSVYSAWLMGGGGAVFGWFAGLVLAGVWLGPTAYCAALCPTGAALSLAGKRQLAQVALDDPARCGRHCNLCSRACWLSLDPASGDPGPDCDRCARCFAVCPRDNLRLGLRARPRAAAAALLALCILPAPAAAQDAAKPKPGLILEQARRDGAVTATLSLVDLREVRLDADDPRAEQVIRLSLVLWRGERGAPDELGKLPPREIYQGPLELWIHGVDGQGDQRVTFSAADAPRSTPRRRIYRRDLLLTLGGGEEITLPPIKGWTRTTLRWQVPPSRRLRAWRQAGWGLLAGLPTFLGLLSLALALPRRDP